MKCKCGSNWVCVCPDCNEYTQTWKWISVKERLPDSDGMYEVCYESTEISERCCAREWFIDGEWIPTSLTNHLDIIYWMPLPEPPKDNNDHL